jgi:hypothetical protein
MLSKLMATLTPTAVIGFVEIIFGMIAIAMAMKHASNLSSIVKTSSTRYLADFPSYLSDLAELLARAKKSIVIFCDHPAYGRFSSLQAFVNYKSVLEQKRAATNPPIAMDLTCLSKTQRAVVVDEQFAKMFTKKEDAFLAHLKRFLEDYGDPKDNAKDLALPRFSGLVEEANTDMIKDLFPHNSFELDQPMHFFFWVVDGVEAIFSIVNRSEKGLEHGFFTRDSRLINAFLDMRKQYQDEQKKRDMASVAKLAAKGAPDHSA